MDLPGQAALSTKPTASSALNFRPKSHIAKGKRRDQIMIQRSMIRYKNRTASSYAGFPRSRPRELDGSARR